MAKRRNAPSKAPMNGMPITVVIADRKKKDRLRCHAALQTEDGIQVIGEAASRHEVLAALKRKPRVLLLDFTLSHVQPDSLVSTVRRESPDTRVVLMTDRATESRIVDALSQGARGYLWKEMIAPHLPRTVRVVDAGEAWIPRMMVALLLDRLAHLSVFPARRRRAPRRRSTD
jgi:DNA-binding NarL/FixJ family response regulator